MTISRAATSRTRLFLLAGLGLLLLLAALGIWGRGRAASALAASTQEGAVPQVSVENPHPAAEAAEIVLPGNVQALVETPIFARTSGYVARWSTDIGAHVKAGQLLAEINAPEVDQQLRQAQGELATAQADNRIAQATARRVHDLLPSQSVSQQQDDQAASDAAARSAAVASNSANVARLRQLVGFERVVAPYAGVVTARETEVGNLINAGSGAGAELFRIADTRRLRIYVQVPQSYAAEIRPGIKSFLTFPEYPGRSFPATFVRTAGAIDPRSRTLLVELQVDNAGGELLPGGYSDVHFSLPGSSAGVMVSANALLFRAEGLRVATVDASGRVALKPIQQGRDFGTDVEILTGIGRGDRVILNPPASLETGDRVHVVLTAKKGAAVVKDGGRSASGLAILLALLGCDLAPHYVRPAIDTPPAYKEADGWSASAPRDDTDKGHWWTTFGDPVLNALEDRVALSNQDLKAAAARYDEARAQARVARADLFPTVDAQAGLTRNHLSREVANPQPNRDSTSYAVGLDLQYEVDVWGRVRNQAKAGRDRAEAAAGDLVSADLSLHAELATDYFIVRADDAQADILERTARNYARDLELTRARFKVGYAAGPDVSAAEAQYQLVLTQVADIALQRARMQHAIAILAGEAPARFSLAPAPQAVTPPEVTAEMPGTLLERRPDVAAAERRVAAANAEIGVARAASYPVFNLNALLGSQFAAAANLFTAPATAWSLGPSALLNLFDGGRRRALTAQSRASYEEAAAHYRQTVLTAYGEVEDSLASVRQLAREAVTQDAGVDAAKLSSGHAGHLFAGGLSTYYDVVTAQNIQLSAELTAARIHGQRMVASVELIRALGGGWHSDGDIRMGMGASTIRQQAGSE